MKLTDGQLKRFQDLYEARFGEKINRKEAYARGIQLVHLVKHIYKPITKKGL